MITFPVVVVVILIGIPSIIAGYLVTKNFGSRSISSSFSVLIYAVGISIAFAYLLPKGQLVTGDYLIKSPAAFLIGFLIGATAGLVARRSGK